MANISDVPGITGPFLELFKAAGFGTVDSLCNLSSAEILAALGRVNAQLQIAEQLPSESAVTVWQRTAERLERSENSRARRRGAQSGASQAAAVVTERELREAGIDVEAIPVARPVAKPKAESESRANTEIRVDGKPVAESASDGPSISAKQPTNQPRNRAKGVSQPLEPTSEKASPKENPEAAERQEKPSAVAKDVGTPRARRPQSQTTPAQVGSFRTAPLREEAASPGAKATNTFRHLETELKNKQPSERRNRGMLHPDPGRVMMGAVVTVLVPIVCVLLTVTLAVGLVLAYFKGWEFPPSVAFLLAIYPLALFLYLALGTKARCRLCGQKLFVPKHCFKHESAARSIFGTTFAAARSVVLHTMFRCQFCGTKTRLKK